MLDEGRGTCSTKHALLAQLAREQGLALALTLGIYHMTEANTPGVGPVLTAMVWTVFPKPTVICAPPATVSTSPVPDCHLLGPCRTLSEGILPEQIGRFKIAWHQQFLRAWRATDASARRFSFEDIWKIRERCIAALAR